MYTNKKISVIGLGYIGLPTAALFAAKKIEVVGVDINQQVVNSINEGKIHFMEPELEGLVKTSVTEGYLRASLNPEPSDAFLIAVPTPFKNDHKADLSYIKSAAESISGVLKKGDLVVLESSSPVGTTEKMAQWLAHDRPDLSFPQDDKEDADIQIAYCPERVIPGRTIIEMVNNDRIIGGMTKKANDMAVALYKVFVSGECILSDAATAEMCKLTENSFRDLNIAFANELSMICDKLNINVWNLIALANRHPRVNILQPGPGVGGHCIAVDPWFIVDKTPEEARIIRTAREVNNLKSDWVYEKIISAINGLTNQGTPKQDLKLAIFGLAFKPNIDDLRESPALKLAELLAKEFPTGLLIVEPNIDLLPNTLANSKLISFKEALYQSHIAIVLVAHQEFIDLNYELTSHRNVIDFVGILNG
jgi:UDP-N-acetyl-D-mannosaminuronic acid dehydrogenase